MAHGKITQATAAGAITGAAGGPIGIGIGAAIGYVSANLPEWLGGGKQKEPLPPPPPTASQVAAAWFLVPAHLAMVSVVAALAIAAIARRK